jgi:gliding motility-associated-like protein
MKKVIKLLLLLLMLVPLVPAVAQTYDPPSKCDNMDFRRGNFTGWVGHTSVYPPSTPGTNINIPYYYNTGIVNGRQTIMTTSTPDPYACNSVMTLPPNEPFCARLGNGGIGPWGDGVQWQRDYLSYTLTVTPTSTLLTYKYAVILQDPNNDASQPAHAPPIRPRFLVSILDYRDSLIDPQCGFFGVVVDSTVAGFRNCSIGNINAGGGNMANQAGTVYRAWTTVGVDLRKYVGKVVTLQFETWDCGLGGHFGYAYVSSRCDAFELTTQTCTKDGSVLVTAPPGFSYKWFPKGETTQAINVYNANPGDSVWVELTSVSGCTTSVSTKIYPTIAKANFTPNPTMVCVKSPVAFTDSSSSHYTGNNSSIPITNWNWNFGDGGTSTVQNPSHIYTAPGTYTVLLAIANQNGCTDSTTRIVRVLPGPHAKFSMSDVCVNSTVPFTDQSTTPAGSMQTITSWAWTFSDNGATSSTPNTTHIYNTPGTFTIHLAVVTDKGCKDDTSRVIKIWPLPRPNFISTEVCIGDTTQFTDKSVQSDPSDNLINWVWNFGDSTALSSAQNPGHVYINAGTYQVQLIVGTARGCVKDTTRSVVVHPLPDAKFTATPICKGSPVQFHDQSTPAGTIVGWSWNFGDIVNNTAAGQNPSHVYDSSKVYYPVLTITSKYGCKSSTQMPIDIVPLPDVALDANKYSGCSPLCVNFIDLSYSKSDPIKSWSWTFGDGNGSSQQSPSHCYPNAGVYSVALTVTTANSCTANASWANMINVYPHPIANFDASSYETSESTPLINFYDKSSGANFWHWDFGDHTNANAQDTSHLFPSAGTYKVWLNVVNQWGCVDAIEKDIVITQQWTFYVPNAFTPGSSPGVNDGFIGKGTNISNYEMWIFDRWGNMLYHCNDMEKPWNGRVDNGMGGQKTAQEDVYVWKIHLTDVFGLPHNYVGIVSLVR